jgi:outer membrane receptor for ferrienterochelin and colicins
VSSRAVGPHVALAVVVLAWRAVAAEVPPDPFGGPVRIEETVVTGTKVETERWEATVPTQVVPGERIEEVGTVSVENALAEIPGLYVRRNDQFRLGASTVRMQGADPNKVAILVDGRRVRGGVEGVVDLRDLGASNVERVEVIRGPATSLYGSDAMAGVVNVITRQGSAEPRTEVTGALGDFARRFGAIGHGWALGRLRYFVSAQHDQFRLVEQFPGVSDQYTRANRDATQDRDQVGLRLDADPAPGHGVTLSPSFQQQTDPESVARNWAVGGEWRWDTSEHTRLTTWGNRYEFDRTNDLEGFEEDVRFVDWEGETRWEAALPAWGWHDHRLTLGLRGRQQALDQETAALVLPSGGRIAPRVDASVWQVSPFLQSDVEIVPGVRLLVGSSFDVHEQYGLDANPRGTLSWWPVEWLRLSGTVGRGFRAPDLIQLYGVDVNAGGLYALLGNPELEPETDLAYQLEAAVRFSGVDAFVTAFRHEFEDLIAFTQLRTCRGPNTPRGCVPDPLPALPGELRFQTRNFAEAITQGIELGIEVALPRLLGVDTLHDVRAGIGYAFLDTENRSGIEGEDGRSLPFRPRHRALPSLAWRREDWGVTARIWGEYEDDAFADPTNLPGGAIPNYWLWNFKVTLAPWRLLPAAESRALSTALGVGRHVAFFVQGENVFDQEVGDVTTTGQLTSPANYLFGLTARF